MADFLCGGAGLQRPAHVAARAALLSGSDRDAELHKFAGFIVQRPGPGQRLAKCGIRIGHFGVLFLKAQEGFR